MIVHDTPMLLTPPPLEPAPPYPSPPPNVLLTTYTGSPAYWLNPRPAAPPTSGPASSHTLRKKRVFTTLKRPPRTQIAPPPSQTSLPRSHAVWPLELPSTNVMFWTVKCGWSWFWHWSVVHTWS